MSDNIEKTERYLKSVVLPEHVSHQHRQQLRRGVLARIERRQTMSARVKNWKVAAVVAVVIGIGAISVVGVNISKIYYKGNTDDGHHVFISDDLETIVTMDDDSVTDPEQTVRDLEEMKILSQQGKRELLKVVETIGTGRLRTHEYRYQLSDGRTVDMGEGVGLPIDDTAQWQEFSAQLKELRRLQKAGPGENLGTYEETVEGRVFSFKREKYVLSDGTEVTRSVGTPKDDQ